MIKKKVICAYCASGIVLRASQVLSHLIFTITLWGQYYYDLRFVDEETEAQKINLPKVPLLVNGRPWIKPCSQNLCSRLWVCTLKQSLHPQDLRGTVQICSAMTQVCREPETRLCWSLLQTISALPWPFTRSAQEPTLWVLSPPLSLQGSTLSPHSIYPWTSAFPFLLSHPHTYLFLWLLLWVKRTFLVQLFNSRHVVEGMLDSTSGHVGSSAIPTSY